MSGVDPIRIRDLLSNIAEAQNRLRELGQLSETEFLEDYRNKVDNRRIYEIIQNDLEDLNVFRQQVSAWLT